MSTPDLRQIRQASWALLFGLVAAIVVGVFFAIYEVGARQGDLCGGAAENRKAIREVVKGVRALGEDLVLGNKPEPTTIEEAAAVQRINLFADQQLAALELPICER